MKKRIAIITGASGGIGREFTRLMIPEAIDEIWAVARNQERLAALQTEFGGKVVAVAKDLSNPSELRSIGMMLEEEKPVVAYLFNNAGVARMGSYANFSADDIEATISINCTALAVLCALCIPYMEKGSRILNISSEASFQPLPYLNLYAATKVFARSYSRALNVELRKTGITATAVCPGWVDTDLLQKEANGKKMKFFGLVSAERVAALALKDAKKGRDMSVCSLFVKYKHLLTKIMPQRVYIKMWMVIVRKIARKYA
jgi:short-subunit dehydrogenase